MMESAGGEGGWWSGVEGIKKGWRHGERSGSDTVLGIGLQALVVLGTHTKQLKGKKKKKKEKTIKKGIQAINIPPLISPREKHTEGVQHQEQGFVHVSSRPGWLVDSAAAPKASPTLPSLASLNSVPPTHPHPRSRKKKNGWEGGTEAVCGEPSKWPRWDLMGDGAGFGTKF